jgi:pSer/pThr/pTyr-binding forkhead associated (FHA) protein
MQVVLVMFRPDGQRRSFSVVRDMTVIGRREDCDLRIPLGDVSRKHCRLIKDGEALRVEDLGSSNGTFRNGTRVQQSELEAGDTLQVGPVVFVLQVDGVPADEDLSPVTAGAAAGAAAGEEELEVVDEAGEPGEFDPMEALNAAEGSGFEFHMEEEEAARRAAAAGGGESDVVDMGDAAASGLEALEDAPAEAENAPAEAEEAPVELDALTEAEEEPVELDAVADAEEEPVELDALEEAPEELDEVVDLEETEEKK